MQYTGKYKTIYSKKYNKEVNVLEYTTKNKCSIPYCECSECGKPIKNRLFVIQDIETDTELEYLGCECIKLLLNKF